MKFLHKYGTRSNEIRRARKELYLRLAMVVAVLMFFILMFLISRLRPRIEENEGILPETRNVGDPLKNPKLISIRAEVDTLLEEYLARKGDQPVDLEDLKILERAIERQRTVIQLRGSEIALAMDLEQLEELLTMYDSEMGAFLMIQSVQKEKEAQAAWENRDYEIALELIQGARDIQESINKQYPRSDKRSSSRLHQLNNKILTWQTQPLAEEADRLKNEAMELIGNQKYAEARVKIAKALQNQLSLNQNFRSSRFASLARLKEFQEASRRVENAEDSDQVKLLISSTKSAMESGLQEEALAKIEEAAALQQRIIARSDDRQPEQQKQLAEIQKLKETSSSLRVYNQILALRQSTRESLLEQNMDSFKTQVSDWFRETQNLIRNYPNSDFLGQLDTEEVTFLQSRKEDIPTILEMVYNNLVLIPGQKGLYLYATEIPQVLYSSVTGSNPSSEENPRNPVDSITWLEANEFNKRLSWILARPVQLPSKGMFLSALGNMEYKEMPAKAWSSENASRKPQAVGSLQPNDLGFYDLLGNVSEWLDADTTSEPDRVVAIGGTARDSAARLATVPEETRETVERNRFIGFRVAVRVMDEE